jgi:pimeloyl-ACP methyl ester carboxylesterase
MAGNTQRVGDAPFHMPTRFEDGVRYYASRPPGDSHHNAGPIILIHGIGTSLEFWCATAPLLARRSLVFALDLPGSGDSEPPPDGYDLQSVAEATNRFLLKRGLVGATLVGHSLGALVVLQMAALEPRLARRVILVDPTLFAVEGVLTSARFAARNIRILALTLAQFAGVCLPPSLSTRLVRSATFRRLALAPYFYDPVSLDVDVLSTALSRTGGRRAARLIPVIPAAQEVHLSRLMQRVKCAVAIVHGRHDPLLPEEDIARARSLMRVTKVAEIARCGHMPMLERPSELVAFIADVHETEGSPDASES